MSERRNSSSDTGDFPDYFSHEDALKQFQNAYRAWEANVGQERDVSSFCVIEGMGLLGKSAFIEREIIPCFANREAQEELLGLPGQTPIVAKCNYDAFDHAPSKLDVLISLRNQLCKQRVITPRFDYGLKSYCEAIGVPDWEKRLEDKANYLNLPKTDDGSNVLFDELLSYVLIAKKIVSALKTAEKIVDRAVQEREIKGIKPLIDGASAVEILKIIDGLLLEDIHCATCKEASKPVAICIILDAVERSAAGTFWEQNFAKCAWCFTVLSGRALPEDMSDGVRYTTLDLSQDAKRVSEKILGELVDIISPELVRACENIPGLVKIIAATAGVGAQAKDDVAHYLQEKLGGDFGRWTEEQDLSVALKDILSIQMKHLPRDQVQVLYVMAWFGPASPRWLCAQLPSMLQPHSRAMSELKNLPYVYEEEGRWRIHALVAHCLRYLCDSLTMDIVLDNLKQKLPSEPSRNISNDQMEIAEALVRLQSGRLAAEVRGLADEDLLAALWDITAGNAGGLEKWTNLVLLALSGLSFPTDPKANGVVTEFNGLLLRMLQWNEGRRGKPDDLAANSAFARKVVDAYEKLVKTDIFNQLPFRTRRRIKKSRVTALLRCGAILSDQSRGYSEADLHHCALEQETNALSLVLDELWGQGADEQNLPLLLGCLNAVAISSYRLRGYRFAIPLFERLYSLSERYGREVGFAKKGQYLRSYGACLYSYAHDVLNGSAEVIGVGDANEEAKRTANRAIYILDKAISGDPSRAWPASLTKASCCAILEGDSADVEDGSIKLLESVRDEILGKSQEKTEYYSRCCLLLAERYERLGRRNQAYLSAGESYVARYEVKGSRHIDTRKSAQRLRDLKERFCFNELPWEMTDADSDRYPFLREASSSDTEGLWPDDAAALLVEVSADLYRGGLNEDEVHQFEGLIGRLDVECQ